MSRCDELWRRLTDQARRSGANWMSRCPAHEDGRASLAATRKDDGTIGLYCHAGCESGAIVEALGFNLADLFPARPEMALKRRTRSRGGPGRMVAAYEYHDADGAVVARKVRYEPKDFRVQTLRDGKWRNGGPEGGMPLYRLPELLGERRVYVVEGEKDADALRGLGLAATTSAASSAKWDAGFAAPLAGKEIFVLPDNDEPSRKYAAKVRAACEPIARFVAVVELPDLPRHGDVSDWLDAGGTRDQLEALCEAARPHVAEFRPSSDRLDGEREQRLEWKDRVLTYGVRFLDEVTGGIIPGDVPMIGARTGIGKTSLATTIALSNCRAGRRVHAFFLEARERDIERQMKYRLIAERYYAHGASHGPIRYVDWFVGRLDGVLGPYEAAAEEELRRATANLHTYYRFTSFTSRSFAAEVERVKSETDLIVLDHLHYVDSDDDNENRAQKAITKAIADWSTKQLVPVVVIVHLRKPDARSRDMLLPTVDEIHGSSDIAKIATKIIMVAPAYSEPKEAPHLWPTYMGAVKHREDGGATRYAALTTFNARTNRYAEAYEIGRLTDRGQAFTHLTAVERPSWCTMPVANDDEPHWSDA